MTYSLETKKHVEKIFEKIAKKDREQEKAIKKKLTEIIEDPHRFKPLQGLMKNLFRVHIMKSFVLIYSIDEKNKTVIIEDYAHHNKAYK